MNGTEQSPTIHDEFPFDAPDYDKNDESSPGKVVQYIDQKLKHGCHALKINGLLSTPNNPERSEP